MSDFSRIEFRTRDGITLRGDYYQAKEKGSAVVVMAAGFSLLKELSGGFARQFQQSGISALAYDFRNYGSSDGTPRQQTDLYQQADDFHDAITAAKNLPGVDAEKVVMWGAGHGASAAMIAASSDPSIKAVIMAAPFPSGRIDATHFPEGALKRAWEERELMTRTPGAQPAYEKVWRDWLEEGGGDEKNVFIQGVAAYFLSQANKQLAEAAGTPWENKVTLQTFLNIASTEPQDHAYKITVPALYVVNEDDPFNVAPDVHRKVFERMGKNAEFKVINRVASGDLGEQLAVGVGYQIDWLKKIL